MNEDDDVTDQHTLGQVMALSVVTAHLVAELPNAREVLARISSHLELAIESAERKRAVHPDVPLGMRDLWRTVSDLAHDEIRDRKPPASPHE